MTKQDLIQHLLEEINNQNTVYITLITILITIFAFFQWQFSDKQVNRMKEDFKKEYKIDSLNADLEKAKKILGEMNHQITISKAESEKLDKQMRKNGELNIRIMSDLIESLPVPFNETTYVNRLSSFASTINFLNEEEIFTDRGIRAMIVGLANALHAMIQGPVQIQENDKINQSVQKIYRTIIAIYGKRILVEQDDEKIKYFEVIKLESIKETYDDQVIGKNAD